MTRSDTAKKKGIDNTPTLAVIHNLEELCRDLLQPIRDAYGKPIKVTSGYRSPRLNAAVGGSITSVHRLGWGVDIQPTSGSYEDFENEIIKIVNDLGLKYDQILMERSGKSKWLHLGLKNNAGRQRMIIKTMVV